MIGSPRCTKDGSQVGAPHDLYAHPANLFVAGFIGSPSMNFVDGRITAADPSRLAVGDVTLPVPPQCEDLTGTRKLVVGIRPDALVWPPPAAWPTLDAIAVAFLGTVNHVMFAPPGRTGWAPAGPDDAWTAKVPADCPVAIGDPVALGVDVDSLYLFDAATGLALPIAGAVGIPGTGVGGLATAWAVARARSVRGPSRPRRPGGADRRRRASFVDGVADNP